MPPTYMKVQNISKPTAIALRRHLSKMGYRSVAGSGRGTSWTRHDKDTKKIFVEKALGEPRWWTYGFDTRTNLHFTVDLNF